ncbi:hypothetical protein L6452_39993 [Arctium lappa]|uniref:Uncharacterized protein n=1 Tax=Arctium lappa TaxID=4217 RepID=A0ACB8XY12_ARCLA|nr:hypothetical protein L6452_39993 [Arctium lappa]
MDDIEIGAYQVANGGNQASPSAKASLTTEEIKPSEASLTTEEITPSRIQFGRYYFYESMFSRDYFYVSNFFGIYLIAGVVCFYLVRHQISGKKTNNVLDAFYFTIMLMTSTGYGDLSPNSTLAISFASFFAISGTVLMGLLVTVCAQTLVNQSKLTPKTWLDKHQIVGTAKNQIPKQRKPVNVGDMWIPSVILLVIFMVVGMSVLVSLEKLDFDHAFYCIVATISSVGNDKCFSTKGGRTFGVIWMLYTTYTLGIVFFTFAESQTQKKQRSLEKQVLKETTPADFRTADLDDDGVLVISEYTLYKLSEMGKFGQDDMVPIMEDFRRRDVNNKGWLTLSDIMSSQQIQVE